MSETRHNIQQADALEFLRGLPDSSVSLILTDPPYFRVKALEWDRAWASASGFIAWLSTIAAEWRRVLKPNGTLVCFAAANPAVTGGATLAAQVEVMLSTLFNVAASVVWVKADKAGSGVHNRTSRDALRTWFPQTERAIVCEHYGADNTAKGEAGYAAKCDELRGFVFEPLRAYLAGEWERAGLTAKDANEATGTQMAGHWFSRVQWALPSAKHYATLQARANAGGGDHIRREYGHIRREYEDLRREYDHLRREYEDLRREYDHLRRPFDATAGAHFTDVWTYHTVQSRPGKHPCEKPAQMARDIVAQCSRPGDVVLDTFAGSGVFLRAAAELGRVAWGCDKDEHWAKRAADAVASASWLNGDGK